MTPSIARNIAIFLQRITLSPTEIGAYLEAQAALQEIAEGPRTPEGLAAKEPMPRDDADLAPREVQLAGA